MNIQQIKADIAAKTKAPLTTLTMVRQLDQTTEKPTEWLSHWDNDNRIRVTMHQDIFNEIKANPAKEGLAVKREDVPATDSRAAYTRFVVITPKNIEGTF
jgi:hypothetical protein